MRSVRRPPRADAAHRRLCSHVARSRTLKPLQPASDPPPAQRALHAPPRHSQCAVATDAVAGCLRLRLCRRRRSHRLCSAPCGPQTVRHGRTSRQGQPRRKRKLAAGACTIHPVVPRRPPAVRPLASELGHGRRHIKRAPPRHAGPGGARGSAVGGGSPCAIEPECARVQSVYARRRCGSWHAGRDWHAIGWSGLSPGGEDWCVVTSSRSNAQVWGWRHAQPRRCVRRRGGPRTAVWGGR